MHKRIIQTAYLKYRGSTLEYIIVGKIPYVKSSSLTFSLFLKTYSNIIKLTNGEMIMLKVNMKLCLLKKEPSFTDFLKFFSDYVILNMFIGNKYKVNMAINNGQKYLTTSLSIVDLYSCYSRYRRKIKAQMEITMLINGTYIAQRNSF